MSYREPKRQEEGVVLSERVRRTAAWRTRSATSRWRTLPDFVIIGGQRCGTTSLYAALSQHNEILPSFRKEVHFFDFHYERGTTWYRSNFPMKNAVGNRLSVEATPNYLAYPGAASRLHEVLPGGKLVVLLRDPTERTYSSWKLKVDSGHENRAFDEAVDSEIAEMSTATSDGDPISKKSVVERMRFAHVEKSRYADHLRTWLELFDRSKVLILQSEKLFEAPETYLTRVEDFLGIPKDTSISFPHFNKTPTSSIHPPVRERLRDYFAPQNNLLEQLTGQRFDWL
ncbi:MAG: sulfotransferase [Acidimicrobiia bacterium]